MSRDVLSLAARALREASEEPVSTVAETRARIVSAVRDRGARRLSLVRIIVPLAAVLIGSSAWGAATGRLPSVAAALGFQRAQPVAPAQPTADASPAVAIAEAAAPAVSVGEPARDEELTAATSAPVRVEVPKAERRLQTPSIAASTRPADVDPDYDLYLAAHRLHFVDHAPQAALNAWDDYLRAAPRGRFALEAHYNRALCLVRLGRRAEAETALEPFARGAYGGYRKVEAQSLLDALKRGSP
jgi:hypothetical protein